MSLEHKESDEEFEEKIEAMFLEADTAMIKH